MNRIDRFIKKCNFRKMILYYIIFAAAALLVSGALLGIAYKNKLLFVLNFSNVSDKIQDEKKGVDAVKTDITKMANQSSDIVDVLILDNHNNIIYSAKNSEFSKNPTFKLERYNNNENNYFTAPQDSDVIFQLVKQEDLLLSTVFTDREKQIESNFRNNTFFKDNSSAKEIYLLSYTIDPVTGNKIYFINDVHPIPHGEIYIQIMSAVLILLLMLYWVLVAFWVYQDARKSRINSLLWGILALCTNVAGLFTYLIYKQNNQICSECNALQNKGNIYCIHCGTKINNTCENCSAITNKEDKFCYHCGMELVKVRKESKEDLGAKTCYEKNY